MAGTQTAPSKTIYSQVSQSEGLSPEQVMQAQQVAKYRRARKAMLILIAVAAILVVAGIVLTILGALIGQVLEIALGGALLVFAFMLLFPALLCYFRMKKIAFDSTHGNATSSYVVQMTTTTESTPSAVVVQSSNSSPNVIEQSDAPVAKISETSSIDDVTD